MSSDEHKGTTHTPTMSANFVCPLCGEPHYFDNGTCACRKHTQSTDGAPSADKKNPTDTERPERRFVMALFFTKSGDGAHPMCMELHSDLKHPTASQVADRLMARINQARALDSPSLSQMESWQLVDTKGMSFVVSKFQSALSLAWNSEDLKRADFDLGIGGRALVFRAPREIHGPNAAARIKVACFAFFEAGFPYNTPTSRQLYVKNKIAIALGVLHAQNFVCEAAGQIVFGASLLHEVMSCARFNCNMRSTELIIPLGEIGVIRDAISTQAAEPETKRISVARVWSNLISQRGLGTHEMRVPRVTTGHIYMELVGQDVRTEYNLPTDALEAASASSQQTPWISKKKQHKKPKGDSSPIKPRERPAGSPDFFSPPLVAVGAGRQGRWRTRRTLEFPDSREPSPVAPVPEPVDSIEIDTESQEDVPQFQIDQIVKEARRRNAAQRAEAEAKGTRVDAVYCDYMCVPGAGSGSSSSQPVEIDAESQEDEPQFQIDYIVAEKIEGGRLYYKVKWTGYLESDNTWEPSSGLAHCEDILEDWVCEKQRRARQFETDHSKSLAASAAAAAAVIEVDGSQEQEETVPETPKSQQGIPFAEATAATVPVSSSLEMPAPSDEPKSGSDSDEAALHRGRSPEPSLSQAATHIRCQTCSRVREELPDWCWPLIGGYCSICVNLELKKRAKTAGWMDPDTDTEVEDNVADDEPEEPSADKKEEKKEERAVDEGLPGHWRYYRERRDGHPNSEFGLLLQDRPVCALIRNYFGGEFINKVSGRTPHGADHIAPVVLVEIRDIFENETGKGFACTFVDDKGMPSSEFPMEPDLSRDLILAYNAHPSCLYADHDAVSLIRLVDRAVNDCFDPVPKATQGPFKHNGIYYRLNKDLGNRLPTKTTKANKRKRDYGTVRTQKARSNKRTRCE